MDEKSLRFLSIVKWSVILCLVGGFVYFAAIRPKKPSPNTVYMEKVMAKYNIDGEMPYDYYKGFDDGVKYAKEHLEELANGTSYEDSLLDAGYETGYSDGYDAGYLDGKKEE